MQIIETERLKLLRCDRQILQTAISGNESLSKLLKVDVPEQWTEFGERALMYSLAKLSSSPKEDGWWTYFPIHKKDNKLIGSGGYKGSPSKEGMVEIGYEIYSEYRCQGLATEFTRALVSNAFKDARVKCIVAHTLGESNPSTRVLTKNEFVKVEEFDDPEDGTIWKWELKRK